MLPEPPPLGDEAAFSQIAPHYDELMQDVPYVAWVRYVLLLTARHDLQPTRVLDLACGTGTVSMLLAARGMAVTGVDGSEPMLQIARRKAVEAGRPIPFIQGDLRSFVVPGRFDLVICLYDSLNNVLEPEGVQAVFHQVRRVLDPGGLFIFDVNTDYALRANMFSQKRTSPLARIQYLWESRYDYGTRLCTVDMDFWVQEPGGRRHFREVHRQRAYSVPELERFLHSAGLELLETHDGLSLRPPDSRTDRMYVVARARPESNDG